MLFCTNQEHPFPHKVPSPQEDSAPLIFSVHGSSCLKHWIPVLNLNWCACVNKTSIILKGYFGAAVDNADDPERAFWVPRAGLHPMRGQLPGHTPLLSSALHCQDQTALYSCAQDPPTAAVHWQAQLLYCEESLLARVQWRQRERRWAGCGDFCPTQHTHTHSIQSTYRQHTAHIQHTDTHTQSSNTQLTKTIT